MVQFQLLHICTQCFKVLDVSSCMYVALRRTPGILGVPCPCSFGFYSRVKVIFGGCPLDVPCLKHVNLFSDVTSLNDALTSSVMSQHPACVDHMTF